MSVRQSESSSLPTRGRKTNGAPPRGESVRAIANVLCLPRLCDRAVCRRTKCCRGDARRCIESYSPDVPLAARKFVVDLLNQRELGYTLEEALRNHPDTARAFFEWQNAAR